MVDQEETAENIQVNLLHSHLDDVVIQAHREEFYQKKTVPFFTKIVDKGKKKVLSILVIYSDV